MKPKIGWHFHETLNGTWKGFNDGDIAHFKGDRYGSLAREIIQNSLDAVADTDKPVEINFELLSLPVASIPDRSALIKKFKKCKPFAADEKQEAGEFFEKAIELLESKKIPVLKISEKNTKGMPGPCELGNPLFAYMKATGTSKKGSDTATGSHGIGKKAPLTTSNLRTIFVSTKWKEGKTLMTAVQGIATLMSHKEGKKTVDGVGYWGVIDGCGPVELPSEIPESFARDTVGTNFYVIGFRERKNWVSQLIAAVAKNFFAAIWRGRLVVRVNDKEITKSNIEKIFNDEVIEESIAELKGEPESFLLSKEFLLCEKAKADQKKIENSELVHLGNCQIQIYIAEGFKQRVCVLRNDMLITTQLDRLSRFPNMKEFVAIIECKSDNGIRLLRGMEPACHDTFDPEQFEAEESVRKGTLALKKLAEWARQMLKKHAQMETSGGGAIDFLSDLFQEELEAGGQSSLERNPDGKLIFQPKPIRVAPQPKVTNPDDDEDDDEVPGPGPGPDPNPGPHPNPNPDPNPNPGPGPKPGPEADDSGKKSIQLKDVRAIMTGDMKTKIYFTPEASGNIELAFYAMGADAEEFLPVEWASDSTVVNGFVQKKVVANERTFVEVKTKRLSVGGIKVTANEI